MKVESKYIWFASTVAVILTFGFIYKRKIYGAVESAVDYAFTQEQEHYLSQLHPKYQNTFRKFIADIEQKLGYKVLITSGYRTFLEQAKLHTQNSQNAKPGVSLHNYGLALDMNLLGKGTTLRKDSTSAEWQKTGVVDLAKKYGLEWDGGGNFGSYHDPVHFEVPMSGEKLYADALKQYGRVDKVIGNRVNIA